MRRNCWLSGPLLCWSLVAATGCGTLTSGTSQNVRLTVEPANAAVSFYQLDGNRVAHTEDASNGVLQVPRPKGSLPYLGVVHAEGHCPVYGITKVNPTAGYMGEVLLLAIPFIQVIGFTFATIDDNTGGCCALDPLIVVLEPEGQDARCE